MLGPPEMNSAGTISMDYKWIFPAANVSVIQFQSRPLTTENLYTLHTLIWFLVSTEVLERYSTHANQVRFFGHTPCDH